MYGDHRELITKECVTCRKHVAMEVDKDDIRRHQEGGVYVQHAFADRSGKPYLTPAERELWISGCCNECWAALCPTNKSAYN